MEPIPDDAKAFAQTTLQVLLTAQLPEEQWQEVEAELQKLQRALEQNDAHAFRQARERLEELGHPRIGRIGKDPKTAPQPPSPAMRDYLNHLVSTLQPPRPAKPPNPTPPANQPDGNC